VRESLRLYSVIGRTGSCGLHDLTNVNKRVFVVVVVVCSAAAPPTDHTVD